MLINSLIVCVLFVLTGFNVYYLFYLKSYSAKKIKEIELYHKLDAKIELQKYLALGLIAIASIFGYSEFSDLSTKFENLPNIEKKFSQLSENYEKLKSDNEFLQKDLEDIKESFQNFQKDKNEIELEFVKQNYRIKDATRQIPEANIRILTRQLVELNMRDAGQKEIWASDPDPLVVKKELDKSIEMLKIAGFSSEEINNIVNGIKQKYDWIK